ncbi:MAG: bifunctional (p)ppGpp synthetase/guanosine-3',5'-bis(diphosphate) 3'-pyrophosphohydrolase [Anaerolineales bacterium]|nr:bifunctional (p)ppGpp synthetase/guanosine-3',5'-bis(diphosphate) 3'-pyrophosphohydrolase [Anaerolineales bacterium]
MMAESVEFGPYDYQPVSAAYGHPAPIGEAPPTGMITEAEPSPIWTYLRKLKPLPTADGSAYIEIDPSPEERQAIETLWRHIPDYIRQESKELILRAYLLGSYAHRDMKRESGEPYITHPIAVAQILTGLYMDPEALAAGLLHDVAEDTDFGVDYIRVHFGPTVARLVDGVTKLKKIQEKKTKTDAPANNQRAESLRKMMMASIEDLRVLFIKLADRLHNMRTLGGQKEHKRRRTARETLDYYAPIANRLGIWVIKSELEDLSFRYLNPSSYKEIKNAIQQKESDRQKLVRRIRAELERALAEAGVPAVIQGRPKHIYSIYRKMERKGVEFEKIFDVHGFRIIVETNAQCYAALGVVHTMWHPIPGEFDDYIANPKDNMYRSLHTGVRIKKEGRPVEIQIRTREMHETAELGVAAHWQYKEQATQSQDVQDKVAYLRKLMQEPLAADDSDEFVDSMKTDVFSDRVLVFTPNADIIDLPAGSTPIDFAYAIHTELGHRCRGANVNGRLIPLDYKLRTGDQVAIISAKKGGPSRDWLNPDLEFTKTQRARGKIRAWLRKQERGENIMRGRQALEKELDRLSADMSFETVSRLFKYEDLEDFLAAIGYGDVNSQQIAAKVLEFERREQERLAPFEHFAFHPGINSVGESMRDGLRVQGVEGLLTNLGKCCNPVPGDPIVGYVTKGRGVTIHRQSCPNVSRLLTGEKPARIIEVSWTAQQEHTYPVKIQVSAYDRAGLVRDVSGLVADEHVNMRTIEAVTGQKDNLAVITATLEIQDVSQLTRIMTKIDRLPNIQEVRRKIG